MSSILPILIYLVVLKFLDGFRLLRWWTVPWCIIAGALCCLVPFIVSQFITVGQLMPLTEEILKGCIALVLVRRKRIVFFAEALIYGATIGGGFALLENSIYLYYNPDMLLGTALFRGFATSMLHMGCTALVAVIILLAKYQRWTALLLPLPVALHYIYNMHLLPPIIQLGVTVVFFLIVFVAISIYNERRIYQWMDHSITFDVQLLAAIKQGHLADTTAGKYLVGVRQQLDPEVFFDVICFMQLYLELVVAGKSRMLLEQEGLAMPLSAAEQQTHTEKLAELQALKGRIGRIGIRILRPVISLKDTDLRVL